MPFIFVFLPVECMEGDVRLDGGTLSSHVEVCHGGHWGLVCHDSWDDADANIVCRQLGYSGILIIKATCS